MLWVLRSSKRSTLRSTSRSTHITLSLAVKRLLRKKTRHFPMTPFESTIENEEDDARISELIALASPASVMVERPFEPTEHQYRILREAGFTEPEIRSFSRDETSRRIDGIINAITPAQRRTLMNYNIPLDRVRNRHEAKRIIHGIYSKQPPTPQQVAELERLNSQCHNPRDIDFSVLSQASASDLIDAFRKEAPPTPHQIQSLSRLGIRDHQMPSSKLQATMLIGKHRKIRRGPVSETLRASHPFFRPGPQIIRPHLTRHPSLDDNDTELNDSPE